MNIYEIIDAVSVSEKNIERRRIWGFDCVKIDLLGKKLKVRVKNHKSVTDKTVQANFLILIKKDKKIKDAVEKRGVEGGFKAIKREFQAPEQLPAVIKGNFAILDVVLDVDEDKPVKLIPHTKKEVNDRFMIAWIRTHTVIFSRIVEAFHDWDRGHKDGKHWRDRAVEFARELGMDETREMIKSAKKKASELWGYQGEYNADAIDEMIEIDENGYVYVKRYEWTGKPFTEKEIDLDDELKKITNTWRQGGHGVYFCPENLNLTVHDDFGAGGWYGEMCHKFGKPKRTYHAKIHWKDIIIVDDFFIEDFEDHVYIIRNSDKYSFIRGCEEERSWSPFTHYIQYKLHKQKEKKVIWSGGLDFVSLYPEKFEIINIEGVTD